jgi:chromosome segregation ATPase
VGALALAFRQAKKDIEKANEAVEEYKTQCSELESTLHSNQRTVASIKDEFAKLSHGIGSSGENIGLTSDEFERYNSIANQIADMFPDMVQGYTDQGNAILSCKGNVQALTEALREQQEAYYNTLLSGADTI